MSAASRYAPVLVGVAVGAVVAAPHVPGLGLSDEGQRVFNAALFGLAAALWMRDMTRQWGRSRRRTRRVSAAMCGLIFAAFYSSLEAAFHPDGDPLVRVTVVTLSAGWLAVALLWHPADDWLVPEDRVYPWEFWLRR